MVPAGALVLLIGASGSGKSTFAARHFDTGAVISSDRLRAQLGSDESDQGVNEAVFERVDAWVAQRLQSGELAVVDATNTDWMRRADLVRQARRWQRPAIAIVLDLDLETCLQRNTARGRAVKPAVIRRQIADLRRDRSRLDLEGFAAVYILGSAADVDQARFRQIKKARLPGP